MLTKCPCALLALAAGCGHPDFGTGVWAVTAPVVDARVTDGEYGVDASVIVDASDGEYGADASVIVDAGVDASDGEYGTDASVIVDAGVDAGYGSDAMPDDASSPGPDAPVVVDAGVEDAPPDAPICTVEACECMEVCPCAPPPIRETIDLNVDRLDLAPGAYAYLSVTAQMSDGNFVPVYDSVWRSDDSTIAFAFPNGYVYVNPMASPGSVVRISVVTADGLHTASLLLTVASGGGSGSAASG